MWPLAISLILETQIFFLNLFIGFSFQLRELALLYITPGGELELGLGDGARWAFFFVFVAFVAFFLWAFVGCDGMGWGGMVRRGGV